MQNSPSASTVWAIEIDLMFGTLVKFAHRGHGMKVDVTAVKLKRQV